MTNFRNWVILCLMVVTSVAFAQNKITGKVIDGEYGGGLPGASVTIKGTSNGTLTDLDGAFEFTTSENAGQVVISFIGYESKTVSFAVTNGIANIGNTTIMPSEQMLESVVITAIADVAVDRKTPVAVSTIKAAEIVEKLGSQEFPEMLNSTPSVYATKGSGGFGDSRLVIRGFDQKNIAVMVNGMPVNDMENSSVYWSNWAGLSDVTSQMQVQRGLGSSKLAISSVGGTVNILTRAADMTAGGRVSTSLGNDNYFKAVASYNTGKLENGLSASILLSHTMGNGYVDGTKFEGSNYYAAVGYETKNKKHDFQLTFTGAPQSHNQRYSYVSIAEAQAQGSIDRPNIKYNKDWGYLNGKEFNWRRNYYHKPIGSLNWNYHINETTKLASVFYGSWGRGGGGRATGRIAGMNFDNPGLRTGVNGTVNFDQIVAWNQGQTAINGVMNQTPGQLRYNNGFGTINSVNSHDWYGGIVSLNKQLSSNFTLDVGIDARTYKGYHFQNLANLMGNQYYLDTTNGRNLEFSKQFGSDVSYNPFAKTGNNQAINYNNDGLVNWYGGFAQLEYATDNLTAFVQGAISNQGFKRIDYITYGEIKTESSWKDMLGGNVKAGANYNIDEHHNVFVNGGWYSKQPFFNGVYLNNRNDLNPQLKNETIIGVEAGYGYRSEKFNANVNLYRTSWSDRILRANSRFTDPVTNEVTQGTANLFGVEQVHYGAEFDFVYRPIANLDIKGMFSWGDFSYKKNVTATFLDQTTGLPIIDPNTGTVAEQTLYLKDSKVGDAPLVTASLQAGYKVLDLNHHSIKIDAGYRFVDQLYSSIDAAKMNTPESLGALRLPSYNLFDAGATYTMKVGKAKTDAVNVRFNLNNVFNTIYIADGMTAQHVDANTTSTYKGIDTRNNVWFGYGRTWNLTLSYNF
ncbi:TonB-dependent receptor [Flavobacterium agricola]|uniref:TonB-dependent receptor n=1 Tax=Flavobacterium agricola TaxID=2870839 RepID=A0ABY6LY24_9FLAO|nr:TonB-dependent receptor [Flavobacterium agricola]UYW01139.1 TonB-dependent receptor [Flavobacterium agricola]